MRISKILSTICTTTLLVKNLNLLGSGLAIMLIPIFFACDDPSNLGIELDDDDSKVEVNYVEVTLPSSSIYIDSLATYTFRPPLFPASQANLVMFGSYTDSIYGRVTATSYAQFRVISSSRFNLPQDTLTFSKAYISLRVNDVQADRVLIDEEIRLHYAQDTLYSNGVYLSSTTIPYDNSDTLGATAFVFNPSLDSIVNIPLNDSFGAELFEKLKLASNTQEYKDSLNNGYYRYPALVFEPGSSNEGLYSFNLSDDTSAIYIEMKGPLGATHYYKFFFSGQPRFTHLDRDRSSGKLSDITVDYAESLVESPRVYLNTSAGIFPKLNVEALSAFADTAENIIINKAEISLRPVNPPTDYEEILSPIQFFYIKENGKINGLASRDGSLISVSHSAIPSSQSNPLLLTIARDSEINRFNGDVTAFVQLYLDSKKAEVEYPTDELVIHTYSQITSKRVAFYKSQIKLKIFYTKLK